MSGKERDPSCLTCPGRRGTTNRSRQLIVAYDGSSAARIALAHTADLARPGDTVTAINVIPYQAISARIEQATVAQRDQQSEILREAEHFLSRRGVSVRPVAGIGDPANEILRVAEQTDADMIVVGRRRGHKPHVLGPLSSKLVRAATCDVLVVQLAPGTPEQ
jgi:nucleotide-binding universal stress UspA family protein